MAREKCDEPHKKNIEMFVFFKKEVKMIWIMSQPVKSNKDCVVFASLFSFPDPLLNRSQFITQSGDEIANPLRSISLRDVGLHEVIYLEIMIDVTQNI